MKRTLLLTSVLLAASIGSASASNLSIGPYYEFSFLGVGSFASPGAGGTNVTAVGGGSVVSTNPGTQPWTITIADPTVLFVFDAYVRGDVFEAFADGTSLGLTSAPYNIGQTCLLNLPLCAATGGSTGQFLLQPGEYDITLQATASPFGGGTGFFWFGPEGALNPVPEPGTLALLGLGLTGLALSRKRKAD